MLNSIRISTYLENHPEYIVKWAAVHKEWLLDNACLGGGIKIASEKVAFVAWCTINRLTRVDFCTDFDPQEIIDGIDIGGHIAPYVPTLFEAAVAAVKKFYNANHYEQFQDFRYDHPQMVQIIIGVAGTVVVCSAGYAGYKIHKYWTTPSPIPDPPPLPPVELPPLPPVTTWWGDLLCWLKDHFVELSTIGLFLCLVVMLLALFIVVRAFRRLSRL